MSTKKGSVFLIPSYLSESNDADFLAPWVLDVVKNTSHYLVENVRTARRFISSLKLGLDISTLEFEILDKKSSPAEVSKKMEWAKLGHDVGIISEAGLPGLADPGSLAIAYAHNSNIDVVPLPGPSSIQTAIISSGFSGQQFTFHGYLPIQKNDRAKAIKKLEQDLKSTGYTQVFMETPFRNNSLIDDLIKNLAPNTLLSISSDIFGKQQFIKTQSIKQWQQMKPNLHKIPAVYCIGQFS